MSNHSDKPPCKAKDKLDDFDFIHMKIFDVHGIPKGRLVSRKEMQSVLRRGMGFFGGVCFYGVQGEPTFERCFSEDNDYGNDYLMPDMDTLRMSPPSIRGQHRLGEVLCYLIKRKTGSVVPSSPREVALKQVDTLKREFGLTVKSAFELEFQIRHIGSGEVFGHSNLFGNSVVMDSCSEVLMELVKDMAAGGIDISTIMPESGPGQWELTLDIAEGIEAADKTARLRSDSVAFLKRKNLERTFMTAPFPNLGCNNGLHFNFSLWTTDGKNALLDASKSDSFSDLGRHFVAGLVEHAPAMAALCCPTINCYRRPGINWVSGVANWAIHHRSATFRVKTEPEDNIFVENRLPSSAGNAYLVLAATLAAGMDGMRRKLPLCKQMDEKAVKLPSSLDQALNAMNEDKIFVDAIGQELVDRFLYCKRTFELEPYKAFEELSNEAQLEQERKMYYSTL